VKDFSWGMIKAFQASIVPAAILFPNYIYNKTSDALFFCTSLQQNGTIKGVEGPESALEPVDSWPGSSVFVTLWRKSCGLLQCFLLLRV
jgi:hypothetical protein